MALCLILRACASREDSNAYPKERKKKAQVPMDEAQRSTSMT